MSYELAASPCQSATPARPKRRKLAEELIEEIRNEPNKTLKLREWNLFQRAKKLLLQRGGKYGTLPTAEERILHQVKCPDGTGILTVEFIAK